LAASKATIVDASGLLTLVLDDGEWNTHSVNQLVGIGGAAVIAPRPAEPVHVPITAGMTNAQISVAKYDNDRHLKNEIILRWQSMKPKRPSKMRSSGLLAQR
jgi:hypothetical protein